MSDDIIRIDGVEYEEAPDFESSDGTVAIVGLRVRHIRPKRKQTGWICRVCVANDPCFCFASATPGARLLKPSGCPFLHGRVVRWQPFYGKVVE